MPASIHKPPRLVRMIGAAGGALAAALWLATGCSPARSTADFAPLEPQDPGTWTAPPTDGPGAEEPGVSSWATLLELALRRNPMIREAEALHRAAQYEVDLAGALPDPMVMLSLYATELETRIGPARWALTLQQRIPFPTKLHGEIDVARARHAVEGVRVEIAVRDTLAAVVESLHESGYLREALAITAEVEGLLDGFAARAQAEFERGRVSLPEVHRVEAQRAQLVHDRLVLAELEVAELVHLRSLLALPDHAPLPAVPLPAPRALVATHEEAQRMAEEWNQELRAAAARVEVEARGVDLARQGDWPDLQLGATWTSIDRLRVATPPRDSGKDPLMVQLGITVPWLWNPVGARVGRSRARELAAGHALRQAREALRSRVAKLYWRASSTARRLDLVQRVLLPQAQAAAVAAGALFDEGQESFLGLLETVAAWHEFRLAEARSRADLAQSLNRLEQAIGIPFERRAEGEDR